MARRTLETDKMMCSHPCQIKPACIILNDSTLHCIGGHVRPVEASLHQRLTSEAFYFEAVFRAPPEKVVGIGSFLDYQIAGRRFTVQVAFEPGMSADGR